MDRIEIRKDTYFDSVFLMAISADLAKIPQLEACYIVLATPANLELLEAQDFDAKKLAGLGPTDLIIALRAGSADALDEASAVASERLAARPGRMEPGAGEEERPAGLAGGLSRLPDANLALISVPGQYAAFEARKALDQGLHVMIFSNNVPIEEEIALKERAARLDLLVMGPDCGTAMIQGKPLGFANQVRSGAIGLVGASGTGLQEVACQIHRLGGGISHIIGTGGRDLKARVGGRTTIAAIELLAADPKTRVLVLVSKPPAREVARNVVARLRRLDKPSIVCFVGDHEEEHETEGGNVQVAHTLREAGWLAHCMTAGHSISTTQPFEAVGMDVSRWVAPMAPQQRFLHGLFTGGTLGGEALRLLRRELEHVHSNLDPAHDPEAQIEEGHTLTDLGDDRFTRGKPHPMIDPTPRCELIAQLGSQPDTAVLLLDLVLGHGCHPDPAGPTVDAIGQARAKNPTLLVVASVAGTNLDPQGLTVQQDTLREAGVQVMPSNVAATTLAAAVIRALEER